MYPQAEASIHTPVELSFSRNLHFNGRKAPDREHRKMPKPELEFFPVEDLPFQQVAGAPAGHVQKILTEDPEKMMVTRIMKVPPHSNNPEIFVHDFWEEVYILEGRQWVGDKLYTKGMYACRPPGMVHGPFRTEDEPCVTFEIRYKR